MANPQIAAAEALIRAHPNRSLGWERLGEAHQAAGRFKAAAEAFDRALALDDRNIALALKLARALLAMKNFAGARQVLAYAERVDPNDLTVADLTTSAAAAMADWSAVERSAQKIVDAAPDSKPAWRTLARARAELGRYDEARGAFERALAGAARSPADLVHLARLSINALDFSRAGAALAEAEAATPDDPSVLAATALLLTYKGRAKEAEDYCLRCLKADPANLEAYPQLSALRQGRLTAEEEAPLKTISRSERAPPASRATASFILAHSLDARGDIDAAFSEYSYANGLSAEGARREGLIYDADGADGWAAHIIKTFDGAPADVEAQEGAPAPIFIVGLPRSGSTLVESVLNAHSEVTAAGEAPMLPPLFNDWVKARGIDNDGVLAGDERRRFLAGYMAGAPRGALRFTDKNLLNIEAVGVIAQLFPAAKIVNVRRAPLECGLAIYRQDFLKFWTYATSLENIGRRYVQYARLTRHWERLYGERFITVQYETFTDHFETEATRLVAACDLAWEDACRDFQSAERIAATISAAQVREPVRKRSGRAAAYASYLGPLRAALEAAGVDLETGALNTSLR